MAKKALSITFPSKIIVDTQVEYCKSALAKRFNIKVSIKIKNKPDGKIEIEAEGIDIEEVKKVIRQKCGERASF